MTDGIKQEEREVTEGKGLTAAGEKVWGLSSLFSVSSCSKDLSLFFGFSLGPKH
jgi:hypothetical protein